MHNEDIKLKYVMAFAKPVNSGFSNNSKMAKRNLSMNLRHPASEFSVERAQSRALASVY